MDITFSHTQLAGSLSFVANFPINSVILLKTRVAAVAFNHPLNTCSHFKILVSVILKIVRSKKKQDGLIR